MTVEINVGVEPVARRAKDSGNPYAGVNVNGNHRPGYLPLAAAKTLLACAREKGFTEALANAIREAEAGLAKLKAEPKG